MTKRDNDEALMTNDEGMTKPENARDDEERFWNGNGTSVIREEPGEKRVYDLEERTARFGEAVIDFSRTIPADAVTNRIISQLVGAATSVGANYVEADDAVTKKEFLKNNLEEWKMTFVIRTSSLLRHSSFVLRHLHLLRHSSFVIRHFPHA